MWYPATITVAATAEPVTVPEAKRQAVVDHDEDDALLAGMIAAATDYAERYCGVRLGKQTVSVKCDGWSDFSRFPEAPLIGVSSIVYVDQAGEDRTLPPSVFEARGDGLEGSIALRHGQAWPVIQLGSRITVSAEVGYEQVPASFKHAILLYVAGAYANREDQKAEDRTTFDNLLVNMRRFG